MVQISRVSTIFGPQRPDAGLSEICADRSKKTDASITASHYSGMSVNTAIDIVDHLVDGTPPCRFVLFDHASQINGEAPFSFGRDPMFLH